MPADPLALYHEARSHRRQLAGHYNRNVRLDTPDGPVVVRSPIPDAATMDLAIWAEADVVAAVNAHLPGAPRLLHHSSDPPFQVHEYVAGVVVDTAFPRGVRLPRRVRRDLAAFLPALPRVPRSGLPPLPEGWPDDGDVTAFAGELSRATRRVHDRYRVSHRQLFDVLGFPAEPLAGVDRCWPELASRPFGLVHADIHRKNLIDTGTSTVVLDWELALWGDPLYDLAVHLHKMSYQPDEESEIVAGWLAGAPPESGVQWRADLDRYLHHEQVKSAIVDSVRYAERFSSTALAAPEAETLIDTLAAKVRRAHRRWGLTSPPSRGVVEEVLRATG